MIKKINYLIILLSFAVLLPDLFIYPGVFLNIFGFHPYAITVGLFILATAIRFKFDTSGGRLFSLYSLYFVPFVIAISLVVLLIEPAVYPNFFFSTFHFHPDTLFTIAMTTIPFALPLFDKEQVVNKWKQFVFVSAFIGFSFFIFMKWYLPDIFYALDREDSAGEYLTAFFYLLSSVVAVYSILNIRALKIDLKLRKVWVGLLALGAIGCFLVAGEELSWGQRVLNISTPEALREINKQEETNIHNLEGVFDFVYDAYLLLGYYGAFSWVLVFVPVRISGVRLSEYLRPVISRWYFMTYFIPIIAYVIWRYNSKTGAFDIWEETVEIFLGLGVLMIFVSGYFSVKNYNKNRETRKIRGSR